MLGKEDIFKLLDDKGIDYERYDHHAIYDMEESAELNLPHPEAEAKNLFIRDDKHRHYYLITVQGAKRVDLKQFRNENGLRRLSFASEDDLKKYLGLTPGSVTPFGLLNDEECKVIFYLDKAFEHQLVSVHPNDNTASCFLNADDLIQLLEEHGTEVHLVPVEHD